MKFGAEDERRVRIWVQCIARWLIFMGPSGFDYEVLTSAELAQRLKVKESWVVDQSKRSRTHYPIPVFRLGKHRRYRWGSPEMNAWLDRRAGYNTTTRKAGSQNNGGTI